MTELEALKDKNQELRCYIDELKRKIEEMEKELAKVRENDAEFIKYKYKCAAYENVLDSIRGIKA